MIEIDLNAVSIPFDWEQLFGHDRPTDVEIGCGKGRFLNLLAAEQPERNLLGVERALTYHQLCCTRAARCGLENVRLLRTSGEDLLFRLLAPQSVERLFVLFPDPWPKKRHNKRRLMKPDNAQAMARVLKPGGRLLVKSDHPGYAEVIGSVLSAASGLQEIDAGQAFADLPLTGFEVKYREAGKEIFAWALEREA